MLTPIKNSLDDGNETHWFWGIALLSLFIEMFFHTVLPISISNDSYGYLHLSQNILNPEISFERSVGYSLLVKLLGTNLFDNLIPLILVQSAASVAIPLIIFKSLTRFGLKYAILGAITSCIYFYNYAISLYVLTEPIYVLSLTIFAFCLVQYFSSPSVKNIILIILSCWLIAMTRMSGTLHFLSFLGGITVFVAMSLIKKDYAEVKNGLKHILIAVIIFSSISFVHGQITNRTSSVAWPHFVFNWMYRDNSAAPIYYGVIKPENGPAAKHLFKKVEEAITKRPSTFTHLKSGGSEKVQALKPQEDGKYSKESVDLLMDDLINNNLHPVRSWWIEGVLRSYTGSTVETSKILGDAIIEAFITHPRVIWERIKYIGKDRIWVYFKKGIDGNNISLATAYPQQINKKVDTALKASLRPDFYSQWAYDLYEHTGNDPSNLEFHYPDKFPVTMDGALNNVESDNLIGFGHYIAIQGMQVLRLCWIILVIGILIFPFAHNKPLLASVICAAIVPSLASVFISETDPRHMLMTSPIQIVASIIVLYSLVEIFRKIRGKNNAG